MKELMTEWRNYLLKEQTQQTPVDVATAAYGFLLDAGKDNEARAQQYMRAIGELGRYIKDQKFPVSDKNALKAVQIIMDLKTKDNERFKEYYEYGVEASKGGSETPAAPVKPGVTTTEIITNEDLKKAAPGQPTFSREGEFIVAKVKSTNPQYSAYEGIGKQKLRGDQDMARDAAAADARTDLARKIKQAK